MTLPARRDGEGRLSMPLLPTDMVVTPQRDAMAIEVEEYGKTDCLRRVEAPKDIKPGTLVGRYRHTPAAITMTIATQGDGRSEEHTSELQSLMRISYAVFCLKTKNKTTTHK